MTMSITLPPSVVGAASVRGLGMPLSRAMYHEYFLSAQPEHLEVCLSASGLTHVVSGTNGLKCQMEVVLRGYATAPPHSMEVM